MRYVPDDVLTEDPVLNRQTYFVIRGLGELRSSQQNFVGLLRAIKQDEDHSFGAFAESLTSYLPQMVDSIARSHPTIPSDEIDGVSGDELRLLKLAIQGSATDEEIAAREWDLEDALADVASHLEGLTDYCVLLDRNYDVEIPLRFKRRECDDHIDADALTSEFIYDMRAFVDAVILNRSLLMQHAEDAIVGRAT
ncbi:hypothetical protein [Rhizobium ruizarguesonis]|uniref:hypothetical protein n=1 Tax=Rhizobium ruizarguesonis TaxID=2081791 RepID=UPI001031BA28|nr:hypothetical protein [Rhizobium ruizarguesonis]TAZ56693.1 hypothetical protein ELH71_09875 [Rhizobium ruizarguesonis]